MPPFGASSNIALWRAIGKPPVELVVGDLAGIQKAIDYMEVHLMEENDYEYVTNPKFKEEK